jgi:uncharacterized protein with HEPN domain
MKDDRAYLLHVRDAIERIRSYTSEGRDAFMADTRTQDAVIRNIEIIGEAVKRLSEDSRSRRPDIPWSQIAGMRDVLIHHYFGVKLETVWEVVDQNLSPLRMAVEDVLASLTADD